MDTTQVNILNDVVTSGVLAKLSPREGQVLVMLAGYAMRDSRRGTYRTAYAYHGDWAEKLGLRRQTVRDFFGQLEEKKVIKKVGKRHVKNGQPANIYAIAEFEALCDLAYELPTKKKRSGSSNLRKGQGDGTTGHLEGGKVTELPDTLVTELPDTLPEKVTELPDTEKVLDVEVGSGKGTNGSFPSENGNTSNGNPSPDDAEIEAQKAAVKQRLYEILDAARVPPYERNAIVKEISKAARQGETPEERNRIAAQRVKQLEMEFGPPPVEGAER